MFISSLYPPRTSCFAYKDGDCTALKECVCRKKNNCRFYKTRRQLEDENEQCKKRLEKLGYGKRKRIKK